MGFLLRNRVVGFPTTPACVCNSLFFALTPEKHAQAQARPKVKTAHYVAAAAFSEGGMIRDSSACESAANAAVAAPLQYRSASMRQVSALRVKLKRIGAIVMFPESSLIFPALIRS